MPRRLSSRRATALACGLAAAAAASLISCGRGCPVELPPARSSFAVEAGEVARVAEEVSRGAGKVVAAGNGGGKRVIYVFEESHTSRLGQLETALMMLRLRERHNLRSVSLEGALAERGELPTKWFHALPAGPERLHAKSRVAARLLSEGEISNGEFLSLVRPDVRVAGNEIAAEYNVEHPEKASWAPHLLAIAEKSLTQSQIELANQLSQAERDKEFIELVMGADPWVKERYEKLGGPAAAGRSLEESLCILTEIEKKAAEVEAKVAPEAKDVLRREIEFYRVASKRSHTMVENTFAVADAAPGRPVALVIGAAHTEEVVELLKAGGASFAVISPNAWAERAKVGNLRPDAYRRKLRGKSVDEGKLPGSWLSARKPPLAVDRQWLRSKAQLYHLLYLLADAAGGGGKPPFNDLRGVSESFDSLEFDPASVKIKRIDGVSYLVCKVVLLAGDSNTGRKVELWPAVWLHGDAETLVTGAVSFEESLLEKNILEVRAEPPPPTPPTGTPTPPPPTQPLVISKGIKAVFEISEERVMETISGL